MKAAIICPEGFEDISELEIKELIGAKTKTQKEKTAVVFDVENYEELCMFAYRSQSCKKIVLMLMQLNMNDLETIKKELKRFKSEAFDDWFDKKTTFRIKAKAINNGDVSVSEIEKEIGALIVERYNKKVDLRNPDIVFYAHIYDNNIYFGIDFTGFNASKRKYKLFAHASSLNGAIAYGLVRLAGYDGKGVIVDCFAGSGMIPTEAALFCSGISPNHYNKRDFAFLKLKPLQKIDFDKLFENWDKQGKKKEETSINCFDASMWAVKAAQKNAKIAGINKQINFSRVDVEWLDTKFKKSEVDFIVSQLPMISKRSNRKEVERVYKEFFHQAEFILDKKGRIALAVSNKESAEALKMFAAEKGFKLIEERNVWQGKEEIIVLTFIK